MDDALLIAIISESVNATSLARRGAALILVQALRAEHPAIGTPAYRLLSTEISEMGEELQALMALYHIPKTLN